MESVWRLATTDPYPLAMGFKDIDFFANWQRSDEAIFTKVTKSIKNNWQKLRTGSTCCGNHGEPGC